MRKYRVTIIWIKDDKTHYDVRICDEKEMWIFRKHIPGQGLIVEDITHEAQSHQVSLFDHREGKKDLIK